MVPFSGAVSPPQSTGTHVGAATLHVAAAVHTAVAAPLRT
jgi:hypothetical protein